MDIGKFLSTGKTFVHAAKNSLLSKIAPLVVASMIAMAVSAGAAAADGRADQVKDMHRPQDVISTFYQSLAAPGSDRVVIVSTGSADFARVMQSMPAAMMTQFEDLASSNGDRFLARDYFDFRAAGVSTESPFAMRLAGKTLWDHLRGTEQGVCFINAAEAVTEMAQVTPGGRGYVSLKHELGFPTVMSVEDAMLYVTVHELYHCVGDDEVYPRQGGVLEGMSESEIVYRMAINETFADLAAVLAYASREGTFANGLAVVNSLRAQSLVDIGHNTEDMLASILRELQPESFRGMPIHQVMQEVREIKAELDPLNNQKFKDLFGRSAVEKATLAASLMDDGAQSLNRAMSVAEELGVDLKGLNVKQRASQMLDATITSAVRIKEVHRDLGAFTLAGLTKFAEIMGIELSVHQQARIAVFDGTISPPGSSAVSPFDSDRALKVVNHLDAMLADYLKQLEAQQKQSATMRL